MSTKRSLTGIKPSGVFHLGNYLGAVKPGLELVDKGYDAFYFIANYHALTSVHNKKDMEEYTYAIAANWMAFGALEKNVTMYLQSDVPEIFELTWILSCFTTKGLLDRAHAYKDAVAKGVKNINHGLYTYPVLMAADILAFDTDVVPVGKDQKQHIEIARDIAETINRTVDDMVLTVPDPIIQTSTMIVPGLDGEKMSKSYNNIIPVFESPKKTQKLINKIVTDSSSVEDKKDPSTCTIYTLYKLFASKDQAESLAKRYRAGGMGWGEAKKELGEILNITFEKPRKEYNKLMDDKAFIKETLAKGAEKARSEAAKVLDRVRNAMGII